MTDPQDTLDHDLELDDDATADVTGGKAARLDGGVSWGPPQMLAPKHAPPMHTERGDLAAPSVTGTDRRHGASAGAGGAAQVKGPPTPAWAKENAGAATVTPASYGWPKGYSGDIPLQRMPDGTVMPISYGDYLKQGNKPVSGPGGAALPVDATSQPKTGPGGWPADYHGKKPKASYADWSAQECRTVPVACGGWPEDYKHPVPTTRDAASGQERSMTYSEYLGSGGAPVA